MCTTVRVLPNFKKVFTTGSSTIYFIFRIGVHSQILKILTCGSQGKSPSSEQRCPQGAVSNFNKFLPCGPSSGESLSQEVGPPRTECVLSSLLLRTTCGISISEPIRCYRNTYRIKHKQSSGSCIIYRLLWLSRQTQLFYIVSCKQVRMD